MDAERRQIAVLITDVVGFTPFAERAGEEAAFTLMQALSKLLGDVIASEGGVVHGFTGDGVLAVFGAPVAFEDAPLRACRAALAIFRRLEAASEALEAEHGVRPRIRIGLNAGPAVVGRVQDGADARVTVLGDVVNVAARLQAQAEPGTAVMSEAMARSTQGAVETSALGEKAIKGKAEPQRLFRLDRVSPRAGGFGVKLQRGLIAYVGRDSELERLERALEALGESIATVDLVGDAGIGKSRLLHEFREQIVRDRARIVAVACAPDGRNSPFLVFIDLARAVFRLEPDDGAGALTGKLREGLDTLGLQSTENVGLLLNLLGVDSSDESLAELDGVLIGLRTRDLLKRVLQAHCRLAPLILVIEDLHWLDGASEELLTTVIRDGEPMRLLILHTRRPGYDPPWLGAPGVSTLPLRPLSARETARIARARIGVDQIPEELSKLIAARAEGNALFAEEIATFLVERGVVRNTARGLEFDARAAAAALPGSVQSLLAARVDRLPAAEKTLLQAAAVIGRRFSPDLVDALDLGVDAKGASFSAIEALDLVHRDDATGDYVFKHALVRDAIYESLLGKTRAALHLRIAEEIERRGGNRLIEIAETLAQHYAATPRADKAFRYLAMAGEKSLNVYAVAAAEGYLRQALALLERHGDCAAPSEAANLLVRLLETQLLKGDYRQAGEIARTFMPRIRAAGETPELVTAYYYQALSLVQNLELRAAHDLMVEALALADRLDDGRARAYARGGLLQCRTRLGLDSLEAAEEMKAKLLEDCLRHGDNFIRNAAYFAAIWDYLYRGLMKEAREMAHRLIALGDERNDPRALSFANWILGWIHIILGEPDAALVYSDQCLRLAIAPFDRLQGAVIKAVAGLLSGKTEEGLTQILALNLEFERLGALYNILDGPRGVGLIQLGRVSEGIRVIKRTIRERDRVGDRVSCAFVRVLLAEVYIQILIGGQKVAPRVILRNLGALVGAKLFGARRARALLDEAASTRMLSERGVTVARINFDRGQLSAARKRVNEAKRHFERARGGAERQNETVLLGKINAAIAALA